MDGLAEIRVKPGQHDPSEDSGPLDPAKGILLGSLIGAGCWIVIGLIVWLAV